MLARLREAVRIVIEHHATTSAGAAAINSSINQAAAALERHLPRVAAAASAETRSAALRTLWDDTSALRKAMAARGESDALPEPPLPSESARDDRKRASQPLAAFAGAWRASAFAALADAASSGRKPTGVAIFNTATGETAYRIERFAATENAHAFNSERIHGVSQHTHVNMRWDATLDERTCDDCADLDGELAEPGSGWESPDGGRIYHPPMHANCRCVATTVFSREALRASEAA